MNAQVVLNTFSLVSLLIICLSGETHVENLVEPNSTPPSRSEVLFMRMQDAPTAYHFLFFIFFNISLMKEQEIVESQLLRNMTNRYNTVSIL